MNSALWSNLASAPNRRPSSPLEASARLVDGFYALPTVQAAVGEAQR